VTIAIATLLVIHFYKQKHPSPQERVTLLKQWFLEATPLGPKGQFNEKKLADLRIINVYRIFGNLPREQRLTLLDGGTIPIDTIPPAAQETVHTSRHRFVRKQAWHQNTYSCLNFDPHWWIADDGKNTADPTQGWDFD